MSRKKKDTRGGARIGAGRPPSLLGTKKQVHISLYDVEKDKIVTLYGSVQNWVNSELQKL
jgi:hypothetical protein